VVVLATIYKPCTSQYGNSKDNHHEKSSILMIMEYQSLWKSCLYLYLNEMHKKHYLATMLLQCPHGKEAVSLSHKSTHIAKDGPVWNSTNWRTLPIFCFSSSTISITKPECKIHISIFLMCDCQTLLDVGKTMPVKYKTM
jgi:hypothetical protein